MKDIIPYILSINTIVTMILAGRKNKYTWILGLLNQVLWLTWIFLIQAWGLLPMTGVLCVVYTWNHFKWNKPNR